MKESNILVTGSAGYLGMVLVQKLIEGGFQLTCLDRFTRGIDNFVDVVGNEINIIKEDIRKIDSSSLRGIDVIIDLSARRKSFQNSNIKDTFDINFKGRNRLVKLSKVAGVRRYVRITGTSVYGQQKQIVDECSKVNPTTDYSKANWQAEVEALKLNDSDFIVTGLRLPSVYGYSPYMRWDQAVNGMTLNLFKTGKIVVNGKSHRRPFLHILDVVRACQTILQCSEEKISGEIFNVGSDDLNYDMATLAKEISRAIEKNAEIELKDQLDIESHTVSFKKIKEVLGFETQYKIKFGALEVYDKLESGVLKIPTK